MRDSQGNLINVTIFESYLSKYLIEHTEFFEPVFKKIIIAIQETVELNRSIDRIMFSIDSLMMSEYKDYKNIQDLIDNFRLESVIYFIKIFSDSLFKSNKISIFPEQKFKKSIPSLSVLCQNSLFTNAKTENSLITFLKPKALFHEKNRGVMPLENEKPILTKKLGIITTENTPEDLLQYFSEAYEPSQFTYIPDRASNVGKWLSQHNLPIIAGSSGSARDFLGSLLKMISLTPSEIQLFILATTGMLIAKGHHSYFEVIILLDRFGFKLQNAANLYEFYEQTLPKSITATDSYQRFKKSEFGEQLLANIAPNLNADLNYKELPVLSIGINSAMGAGI